MNAKILLLLCLNAAFVNTQFLSLPLLAVGGSPGSIALVTAVIGALKLGAAAILAKSSFRPGGGRPVEEASYDSQPSSGYGHYRRHKREDQLATKESVFNLVSTLDLYSCGKSLVCELETKEALADDERLILSLFSSPKEKEYYSQESAVYEYEAAANLGLASKSAVLCRQRYGKCPYTADEMMAAMRNANF